MLRPGLSRFLSRRKAIWSSSHGAAAASFSSLSNSNFERSSASHLPHDGHEEREAQLWLFPRSRDVSLGFCRSFSVSQMGLKEFSVSGSEEAIGGEYIENAQEADDLSGETVVSAQVESVHSDTSDDERFSCEGVDEGVLEDAEPRPDPEGRSYLHVLTVEEVQAILDRTRADDVQVISVRDLCEWADHLVIASGHSARHLRGIADAICFEVKKRSTNVGDNVYPTVEGRDSEEWMVVDCGSIVVHVFREDIRCEYNLEEMWRKRRPANIKDIGI